MLANWTDDGTFLQKSVTTAVSEASLADIRYLLILYLIVFIFFQPNRQTLYSDSYSVVKVSARNTFYASVCSCPEHFLHLVPCLD